MNVTIYVASHQRYKYLDKIKDPIYKPIHCGKRIYIDESEELGILPELGDDMGIDNISNKNPYYCELTALYWIWKNDESGPDDVVGLDHYRRYFAETIDDVEQPISKLGILDQLWDCDFLVNGIPTDHDCTLSAADSAYENYRNSHIIEDMDNALKCIKKVCPDLYPTIYHEVTNSGAMCLCNMMICRKKHLDEYCNFLFPVFKELEYYIDFDDDNHQGYNQRVFGFLGERLFRPWLIATKHVAKSTMLLNWEKYAGIPKEE